MSIERIRPVLLALASTIFAAMLALALVPVVPSTAHAEEQLDAPNTGIQITATTPATRWNVTHSESGVVTTYGYIEYQPASGSGAATLTIYNAIYDTSATSSTPIDVVLPDVSVEVKVRSASKLTGPRALSITAPKVTIVSEGSQGARTLELHATGSGPALSVVAPATSSGASFSGLTIENCVVKASGGSDAAYAVHVADPTNAAPLVLNGAALEVTGQNKGVFAKLSTDDEGTSFVAVNALSPQLDTAGITGAVIVGDSGRIYGYKPVRIGLDVAIPSGMKLDVQQGATFELGAEAGLTVEGGLDIDSGGVFTGESLCAVEVAGAGSIAVRSGAIMTLSETSMFVVQEGATLANEGSVVLGDVMNFGTITTAHDGPIRQDGTTYVGDPVNATLPDPCDGITLPTTAFVPMRIVTTSNDGSTGSILATPGSGSEPATIELENATIHADRTRALQVLPYGDANDVPVRIVLKGENVLEGRSGLAMNVTNVTIEGDGSLTARGTRGITMADPEHGSSTLTFAGGTVHAEGVQGITGDKVVFSGGTVVANGTAAEGSTLPPVGILAQTLVGDRNAFVVTNSLAAEGDDDNLVDLSRDGFTSGVLIVGDEGRVHGDDVTLAADAEVPVGATLEVPAGTTFTVPAGKKLTNAGAIDLLGTLKVAGTLVNDGTIHVFMGAVLDTDAGTLEDPGEIIYDEVPPAGDDGSGDDGAGDSGTGADPSDPADTNPPDSDDDGSNDAGAANDDPSDTDGDGSLLSLMGDDAALGFIALGAAALSLAFFALFHARRRSLGKHARR